MVKGHFRGHWIKRIRLCPLCIDGYCKDCCYWIEDHCINYDLIVPPGCSLGIYAYKREDFEKMVVIKHTGNGQTLCCGCLAAGKQPIHWDSWIIEIQYDSGERLGSFCYECFKNAAKYLRIEVE